MRAGHAPVIAAEEGEKVFCQIAPIIVGQAADDAEIHADVLPQMCAIGAHRDIARMHVGVKKAIAKHLREENLHALTREFLNVHSRGTQLFDLVDRRGVQPLHHHHRLLAPVPIHLGHVEQWRACKVAPQLGAVGRLAYQIQLVVQIFVELGDNGSGF